MTRAFARVVIFLRWPIVLAWIAGAYLATTQLPSIEEAGSGGIGEIVPAETDAIDAEVRAYELFDVPVLARTLVVQRREEGLGAGAQSRVAERALDINQKRFRDLLPIGGALAVTNAFGKPPFSRENNTTALTYLFFKPEVDRDVQIDLGGLFLSRHVPRAEGPVGVTGAVPAREARDDIIADKLTLIHLATIALVTLVVAIHFRSVVAPLVNLAAVGTAYLVSTHVLAAIGEELEVSVPGEVTPVIVALLFGVMTDYTVFFLSPLRRRLAEVPSVRAATQEVIAQQLPIVLTAGIAVAAASGTLIIAQLEFFRAFGPGIALATLIGVAVALTLVPALVAILGRALYWPKTPEYAPVARALRAREAAHGLNVRVLRATARHPVLIGLLALAVLLAGASGLRHIELGNPLIRDLPADSEPRIAYEAAAKGFAPGILSPTMVFAERAEITRERPALQRLQSLIERQPGVAEVLGPREQRTELNLGAIYARDRSAARYVVVFESDPYGSGAIDAVTNLRDRLPELAEQAGITGEPALRTAGDTAIVADTVHQTNDDLLRIAIAVLVAVTLVLALFLRALLAPFYLVVASVLALAATLGVTTYVFQGLLGEEELSFYVPFSVAVLLVALGSDYNIFVAGRIWLEARRRPLRDAVVVAGSSASSAIAAAALVLAGSFGLLALVPLMSFREIAFAMAAGLLIDAFIVRTVLVPAMIVLFGGAPSREQTSEVVEPEASASEPVHQELR